MPACTDTTVCVRAWQGAHHAVYGGRSGVGAGPLARAPPSRAKPTSRAGDGGIPGGQYRTTITSVAPPPESVTRVVLFHSAVPVFAATRLNIAFIASPAPLLNSRDDAHLNPYEHYMES